MLRRTRKYRNRREHVSITEQGPPVPNTDDFFDVDDWMVGIPQSNPRKART